jgi:hypothetical protein
VRERELERGRERERGEERERGGRGDKETHEENVEETGGIEEQERKRGGAWQSQ